MATNPVEIQHDIDEAIARLPEAVQRLIAKDEWKPWLAQVVRKNGLNLDQASVLEAEVFMLMIGMSNVQEMRENLKGEARLPESAINSVIIDVDTLILTPLKRELVENTSAPKISTPVATKPPLSARVPITPAQSAPAPLRPTPLSAATPVPLSPQRPEVKQAPKANEEGMPDRETLLKEIEDHAAVPAAPAPAAPATPTIISQKLQGTVASAPTPIPPLSAAPATPVAPITPPAGDRYREPIE